MGEYLFCSIDFAQLERKGQLIEKTHCKGIMNWTTLWNIRLLCLILPKKPGSFADSDYFSLRDTIGKEDTSKTS